MDKIIDAHMHVCQWLSNTNIPVFEMLEKYQESNGIEYVDIMCCSNNANLWNGYEMDQSMLAAVTKLHLPTTYIHGCMFIPQTDEIPQEFSFENQLEQLMEIGFDGIKFCEFKPDSFRLHNMEKRLEDFEPYFDYCEKYDVPMCWHVADPDFFWDKERVTEAIVKRGWFYGDPSFPAYDRLYTLAYGILDRHPNLRVMLAHAFFLSNNPNELIRVFEKYSNVTIDLAPGGEMFDGFREHYDDWHKIFRDYSDRIFYATDATINGGIEYVSSLAQKVYRFLKTDDVFEVPRNHTAHGIKLEQKYLDNILYNNSKRNLGDKPKEINRSALKKYINTYLPLMPASKNKEMMSEYYRKHFSKIS